jgi:leucyl/phenylalanyl-tRNA---protein transferase
MTLLPPSRFFPPPETADPDGLLFVGGELSPTWMIDAYRHGVFPWPIFEDPELTAWWSPDPRAVFELGSFHASRRLHRTLRSGKFVVTCDEAFSKVIRHCSTANGREGNTWLTPDLIRAYERLFELGVAHSIEVWHEGELAGGTYGVGLGGLFAAESMFFLVRDASKVGLYHLHQHLLARGYILWDIQQLTSHTASLGATEIRRRAYLRRLVRALNLPVTFGQRLEMPAVKAPAVAEGA